MTTRRHITTSVPIGGRILGNLSKWGAYECAKRGDIEVINLGNRKRVSVVWLENKIGVNPGELDDAIDALGVEGQDGSEDQILELAQ